MFDKKVLMQHMQNRPKTIEEQSMLPEPAFTDGKISNLGSIKDFTTRLKIRDDINKYRRKKHLQNMKPKVSDKPKIKPPSTGDGKLEIGPYKLRPSFPQGTTDRDLLGPPSFRRGTTDRDLLGPPSFRRGK